MTRDEVLALLDRLAAAWNAGDAPGAADCFSDDVVYGDPTRYAHRGRAALRAFFHLPPGRTQRLTWRRALFDEAANAGVVEYTYEEAHRYHGAALFEVKDDRIATWREWQHTSPLPWEEFVRGPT